MNRPIITRYLLVPALLGLAFMANACGGSQEETIIRNYFRAARMGDNTTLGNIATVSFDAQQEGIMRDFTATNISEERRALRVKELIEASGTAQAEQDAFSDEMKAYQDENIEAIDRVLRAERGEGDIGRRDEAVQEEWRTWRDEMSEHSKMVAEARTAVADERGIAEISVMNAQNPVDITQYDAELVTKDVTLDATVRQPDGTDVQKNMVVRMQRAELTGGDGDITGRWIITSIQ